MSGAALGGYVALAGGAAGGGALGERADCASTPADAVSSAAAKRLRATGRFEMETM
jgi:hypothetical protein